MGRHEFTLTTPCHGEVLGVEDTRDQIHQTLTYTFMFPCLQLIKTGNVRETYIQSYILLK